MRTICKSEKTKGMNHVGGVAIDKSPYNIKMDFKVIRRVRDLVVGTICRPDNIKHYL
jgi:hypothetical protein